MSVPDGLSTSAYDPGSVMPVDATATEQLGFYEPESSSSTGYSIPPELIRVPTGGSVIDEQSVVGDFGRTYQAYKEGRYFLPNDAAEQDRLDFQSQAFKVLLGDRLYLAPISHPSKVLDVATGTGIWAVEFAEQHPESEVVGTDLSAIQPSNAPPNCTFVKDDSESEWVFSFKFDYVHLRFVCSCFDNPKKVMQHAYDSMTSGAWMEWQDPSLTEMGSMDGNLDGSAFQRWFRAVERGAKIAVGRDIDVAPHYKRWLEEVGFVNVQEKRIMSPASPWSDDKRMKLTGAYMQRNYLDGALFAMWKLLKASGLTDDDARDLIEEAKGDLLDRTKRFYVVVYVVYGQRP